MVSFRLPEKMLFRLSQRFFIISHGEHGDTESKINILRVLRFSVRNKKTKISSCIELKIQFSFFKIFFNYMFYNKLMLIKQF